MSRRVSEVISLVLAPMCLSISLLGDISDRKWEMIQTAGKDDDPEEQDDEDAGHRRCEI